MALAKAFKKLAVVAVVVRWIGAPISLFLLLFKKRPLYGAGLLAVVTLTTTTLDSCGLEQRVDNAAARGTAALLSPLYGGSERIGQDSITVVTVDRAAVERYGGVFWPLPYAGQLALVEALMRSDPAVIFLDFTYFIDHGVAAPARIPEGWPGSQAPDLSQLRGPEPSFTSVLEAESQAKRFADALKQLSEFHNVPILIGPVDEGPVALRPLAEAFPPVHSSEAVQSGQVGVTIGLGGALTYRARDEDGRIQAAHAMRQAVCARRAERPHLYSPCPPYAPMAQHQSKDDLAVSWGLGSPRETLIFDPQRERCVADGARARIGHTLQQGWGYLTGQVDRQGLNYTHYCTYHALVEARTVLEFSLNPIDPDSFEGEIVDIAHLFTDRAILIGSDLSIGTDVFEVPVYGLAPGVSVHAMALDNLVERGDRYATPPPDVLGSMDWADIAEFVLMIGAVFAIYLIASSVRNSSEDATNRFVWGLYLTIISIAVAISILVVVVMRWPAVNWLFMVGTLAGAAAWIELIRARAAPTLHADPNAKPETKVTS